MAHTGYIIAELWHDPFLELVVAVMFIIAKKLALVKQVLFSLTYQNKWARPLSLWHIQSLESPSRGKRVNGIICLRVDDIFCVVDKDFFLKNVASIQRDYEQQSKEPILLWVYLSFICIQKKYKPP